MLDETNLDGINEFLLKECYEIAALYETSSTARGVLIDKAKRISPDYFSRQTNVHYHESEMQIISEVINELSMEDFTAAENTRLECAHKINNLPNSAEKEYVLALLSLRNGTSETQRLDALRHISAALIDSPNDPRYLALASILQDVDK